MLLAFGFPWSVEVKVNFSSCVKVFRSLTKVTSIIPKAERSIQALQAFMKKSLSIIGLLSSCMPCSSADQNEANIFKLCCRKSILNSATEEVMLSRLEQRGAEMNCVTGWQTALLPIYILTNPLSSMCLKNPVASTFKEMTSSVQTIENTVLQ